MSRARDDDAEVHVPLLQRNSLDQPDDDEAPPYSPPDPALHDQLFPHAHPIDPPFLRLPFTNKFLRLPRFLRPPQRLYNMYNHIFTHPRLYNFQFALGRRRPTLVCLLIFALFLLIFTVYCTVLFSPQPLPDPVYPDKTTTTTARFLTLNIFLRPPGIRNNLSDHKDARIEYFLRYILPYYDVVALQEAFAFGTTRRDTLIREARALGFNYFVESDRKNIFDLAIDGGLLILSKFKIVESAKLDFERGVHNDWFSAKGVLYARLELNPTTHLDLFTTHTQASYNTILPPFTDPTASTRIRQFSRLHDFIVQYSDLSAGAFSPTKPLLLLGDLNVDASANKTFRELPSHEFSLEYAVMIDVLRGDGVDPVVLGHSPDDSPTGKRIYASPFRIPCLHDVMYEHTGTYPVTYGDVVIEDGQVVPAETVLTALKDQNTVQSLDRALFCEAATRETRMRLQGEESDDGESVLRGQDTTYEVKVTDARIEKFLVKNEKDVADVLPFTQVSDHYGISILVKLTPM